LACAFFLTSALSPIYAARTKSDWRFDAGLSDANAEDDRSSQAVPEESNPALTFGWQDGAVLGFEMASSCFVGGLGIGARHNPRSFWKGCAQAMLIAGPLMYAGKKMMAYAGYYDGLAYPAQAVHSLGASMRDNIAEGSGLLDRYQYNVGPAQLSFGNSRYNGGRYINVNFMPVPVAGLIYAVIDGHFDARTSLKMGMPVFRGNLKLAEENNGGSLGGLTLGNVILLKDTSSDLRSVVGHEGIHALDYRELSVMEGVFENRFYGKKMKKFTGDLHLKLGADTVALGLQIFGVVPHDYRPYEFIPMALEVKP